MTRESEIFLDMKKDKPLIITTAVYRDTSVVIHYSCSVYIVYINDVALAVGDSLIHLYADDTILYTSVFGHCVN
jgi:hypothetical protein